MTQGEMILKLLDEYEWVSPVLCYRELYIYTLSTNISMLRQKGFRFEQRQVNTTNRFGKPIHFLEYKRDHEAEKKNNQPKDLLEIMEAK